MPDKVKIAIVGAGNMAAEHCRVFSSQPAVRLAGITSRTRFRASQLAEKYGIDEVFDSVKDLYAGTRADLVVVAVKELGALPTIQEAAAFGWTIFMEKPAGYRLDIAAEIRDILVANRRRAFVGFNRRFYSSTLKAKQLLSEIDGPRHVLVLDQQDMQQARRIGHPEDVVQHLMYANSIHTIDYLRAFCRGAVEEVIRDGNWQADQTFLHAATLKFSSGDTGRYEAIWQGPGPWACSVSTGALRLEMRPLERLFTQKSGERTMNETEMDSADLDFKPGLLRQAQSLLAAFNGGSCAVPDIHQSFEAMELVQSIYGV